MMKIKTKKFLITTISSYILLNTASHTLAESSTTAPFKFIYASTIGTSGYTISNPGYYVLVEDVAFSPSANDLTAITTATDHVTINLNNHSIYQSDISKTGVYGIKINTIAHDVTIQNGTLSCFTGYGIYVNESCYKINIENVNINKATCTSAMIFTGTSGTEIHDCVIENCNITEITTTIVVDFDYCNDIKIINSNFSYNNYAGGMSIFTINDCNALQFINCQFNDNKTTALDEFFCINAVILTSSEFTRCHFNNNNVAQGRLRIIYLDTDSNNNIIKESVFNNNSAFRNEYGEGCNLPIISLTSSSANKIYSCIISNNSVYTTNVTSQARLYGIYVGGTDPTANYISNCLITKNTARTAGNGSNAISYGIQLFSGNYHYVENCTSIANKATATGGAAAASGVGIYNVTANNVIKNCRTFGNSHYGILNVDDSIVVGCSAGYNGTANYAGASTPNSDAVTKLGDNATAMEKYGNANINA